VRAAVLAAHGEPLELVAEMGARWTVEAAGGEAADPERVARRVRDRTGGADVSVNALGSAPTCRTA